MKASHMAHKIKGKQTGPLRELNPRADQALVHDQDNRSIALGSKSAPQGLKRETAQGALAAAPVRQQIYDWVHQAEQLTVQHRYPAAELLYHQIIELCQSSSLPDSERLHITGLAQMNQGWLAQQRHKYAEAIVLYTQALKVFQHNAGVDKEAYRSALLTVYAQRGQCYRKLGQKELAAQDLFTASQLDGDFLKVQENRQEVIEGLLELSTLYIELNHYQKALNTLAQAREHLAILRDSIGGQSALFPLEDIERLILFRHSQVMQAMEAWEQVEEVYGVLLQRISPQEEPLSWCRYALLLVAHQQKHGTRQTTAQHSSYVEQIDSHLRDLEKSETERHILAAPLLALADLHSEDSDHDRALKYYSSAIRCLESAPAAPNREELLAAYAGRARCLQNQDDHRRAIQAFRKACSLSEAGDGQALLLLQLHFSQLTLGKQEDALSSLNQAIAVASPPAFGDESHPATRAYYFRAFYRVMVTEDKEAARKDLESVEHHCPGMAAYDLACLAAQEGQLARSFTHLRTHLSSRFALSREQIEADADLQSLKREAEWASLWSDA